MKSPVAAMTILSALALGHLPTGAQTLHFGLQGTLSEPQGDVGNDVDNKRGFGLGIHIQVPLQKGWAIVPRIDHATYKYSKTNYYPANAYIGAMTLAWDNKITIVNLGADFNFYPSGTVNKGFYVLVGSGYSSAKFESTMTYIEEPLPEFPGSGHNVRDEMNETKGSLYLSAGLGWNFTKHFGLEARYVGLTQYQFDTSKVTGPTLNISAVFRY